MVAQRAPILCLAACLTASCATSRKDVPPPPVAFDPASAKQVAARMTLAPQLEASREIWAAQVAEAWQVVQGFAQTHGWAQEAAEPTFDHVEIHATQAALWARVLALNNLDATRSPAQPAGLVAALEGRVLLAVTPETNRAVHPRYVGQEDAWMRLLAHEMVHRLHVAILAGDEEAMGPQWFFEGFAVVGSGQVLGPPLAYHSVAQALEEVKSNEPLAYRRFAAAVRYCSTLTPMAALVRHAGQADFETWLAALEPAAAPQTL